MDSLFETNTAARRRNGARIIKGVLCLSVLLVEDIATTGGQVLEAAKLIKELGAKVERIVSVIDRQEGARENIEGAGFVFESLFNKADLGITG